MAEELNPVSNPLSDMEVSAKPIAENTPMDNSLENLLKTTGQVVNPTQNLNRSLYTTEFLDKIANESKIDLPEIKKQEFDNLGFSEIQEKLLEQSSQQIADQTNLATGILEEQLQKQIRSIIQGSQDQAIQRAEVLGDVGLNVDKSSRNLSFVSDAQARGQQQILDVTQQSLNQLNQIITGANEAQTQLTSQAVQLDAQNKQFDFQKEQALRQEADRLTQSLGFIYDVQDGQVKPILDSSGNQIPTLNKQQFDINATSAQLEQQARILANQAQSFENQQLFETDSQGNIIPTELGRLRAENAIGQQELNNLAIEQQKQLIQGIADLDNINQNNQQIIDDLNSSDPAVRDKAIAKIEEERNVYGQAYGVYWGEETISEKDLVSFDKDGNATVDPSKKKTEIFYDDKAIQTYGLFLNRPFNTGGYTSYTKDLADKDKPDVQFTEQVKLFLEQGDAQENFNKIVTTSDDKNSILIAHRNISPEMGDGYKFKYINTSLLSETEKNDLLIKLQNVDQYNVEGLNNTIKEIIGTKKVVGVDINSSEFNSIFVQNKIPNEVKNKTLQKLSKVGEQSLTPEEYNEKVGIFNSDATYSFKSSAETRMTDKLPKNKELLPIILLAENKGNLPVLKEKGLIDANYNITKLQTKVNTTLNPFINDLGLKGLSDLKNEENVNKVLDALYRTPTSGQASAKNDEEQPKNSYKDGLAKDTLNLLNDLTTSYEQVMSGYENDTQRAYKENTFKSLLLTAYPASNIKDIENLLKLIQNNTDR